MSSAPTTSAARPLDAERLGAFLNNLSDLLKVARRRRSWTEVMEVAEMARNAGDGLLESEPVIIDVELEPQGEPGAAQADDAGG